MHPTHYLLSDLGDRLWYQKEALITPANANKQ
jgi:hypothetical protein